MKGLVLKEVEIRALGEVLESQGIRLHPGRWQGDGREPAVSSQLAPNAEGP